MTNNCADCCIRLSLGSSGVSPVSYPLFYREKQADAEENILCSLLLRDYIDLPYMKGVRPEDIEDFRNLKAEEVRSILEETPEHLMNIISNILRAFWLKMNVTVGETEELVGKMKEKKMGY